MKKLVLIDSNALVHRAFHALPPTLTSPSGMPVNAVYGFTSVLIKMLKDLRPDYVAATYDLPGPTFRHQEFQDYKGHRGKAPDELYAQIPLTQAVVKAFGIPVYSKKGFEADDVIGSLAEEAKRNDDLQVIIMTGDMDTLQLVDGDRVVVFTLRKGVTDTVTYGAAGVKKRYGITPAQVPDYKGLRGDPSDNIPGVKGIGEKTATALIKRFGSIEKLYETVARGKVVKPLTEKLLAKLAEHRETAFLSKKLATIVRDVPVNFDLAGAQWRKHLDPAALEAALRELGFASLIKRLPEVLDETPPAPVGEPLPVGTPEPVTVGDELIGHDLKPYLKELLGRHAPVPPVLFDTLIAAWLVNPDLKTYPYPGGGLTDYQKILTERMDSMHVLPVFRDIEMPLVPILARMELNGIRVDIPAIERLQKSATGEVARLEREVFTMAGTEFNINSPAQLSNVLFNVLGLRGRVRHTGGGALSTAASELEKLIGEHPIVAKVLEYREIKKLTTTYIEPFPALVAADGRIHTTYHQSGTGTGRLSSSDPNLQNVPTRTELGQRFRAAFVADPGFTLVSLDYSQLELRLVAHMAHDETMIKAFQNGDDIHTRTASEIFGLEPGQVTKDMRRQAKVLNFGMIYGMGSNGFARAAGVPRDTAKRFIDEYFRRFSGVARFMERTKKEALEHGFVSTLFGRRRSLPDITSSFPQLASQAERMAINHPIQGTGADLVKLAMIALDRWITENGLADRVRMLLQVHDELVLEVATAHVQDVARQAQSLMEQVHALAVPLVVDSKAGPNWADMKPLT